jgi:hypothetical protein
MIQMWNVLIGGGDIVFQTKYSLNDHKIGLEQITGLNFDISFNMNISTLKSIQDDGLAQIWMNKLFRMIYLLILLSLNFSCVEKNQPKKELINWKM